MPAGPQLAFATLDRRGSSRAVWAIAAVGMAIALAAVAFIFYVREAGQPVSLEAAISKALPAGPAVEPHPATDLREESPVDSPVPFAPVTPPPDAAPVNESRTPAIPPAEPNPQVLQAPPSTASEPQPAAVQGRLLVRSTPAGALVTVDGQPRGETPLAIRGLELGVHTVSVAGPGIPSWERRVSLTVDRPSQSFDVGGSDAASQEGAQVLQGIAAALQIESRPLGAGVWVDGVRVGTTPLSLSELGSGSHAVRIELPGYRPWVTSVALSGGERARVAASLER